MANASNEGTGSGPQGPAPLVRHSHELPFVAPSSYLRPKPNSRTMSEPKRLGPLDRDQAQGLVSTSRDSLRPLAPLPLLPTLPRPPPLRAPSTRGRSPALLLVPAPGPSCLCGVRGASPVYEEPSPRGLISKLPSQARIRGFLKVRTSYDVLPLSFRLIVLDNDLLIKKSLAILTQNGKDRLGSTQSRGGDAYCGPPGIVSAPLWDSKQSAFAGLLTSTDYINVIQYYRQYPDRLSEIEKFRLSGLRGREPALDVWTFEKLVC